MPWPKAIPPLQPQGTNNVVVVFFIIIVVHRASPIPLTTSAGVLASGGSTLNKAEMMKGDGMSGGGPALACSTTSQTNQARHDESGGMAEQNNSIMHRAMLKERAVGAGSFKMKFNIGIDSACHQYLPYLLHTPTQQNVLTNVLGSLLCRT